MKLSKQVFFFMKQIVKVLIKSLTYNNTKIMSLKSKTSLKTLEQVVKYIQCKKKPKKHTCPKFENLLPGANNLLS